MIDQMVESLRTWRPLRWVLALAILLPFVASAPAANAASHIQPALSEMASAHPNDIVSVIVQKLTPNSSLEKSVPQLGGTVTKDLHIINAFAAEMPGKAVLQLAKMDGVRWVSLDAPVSQSTSDRSFTAWATDISAPASASLASSFNSTAISAGRYVWFTSVFTATGVPSAPTRINFDNSMIQFTANGASYKLKVPASTVTFDPAVASNGASTTFNALTNTFTTRVRPGGDNGNVFLTGLGYRVPSALPGNISNVTWTGRFTTDTPGIGVTWKWSAAVYTSFNKNYNSLGIKPVDSSTTSQYANADLAGTPESYKSFVTAGAKGTGGTSYTGTYSGTQTTTPTRVFVNYPAMIDSSTGRNNTYAYGSNLSGAFTGFLAEKSPGTSITRVEAALRLYISAPLSSSETITLTASGTGQSGVGIVLNGTTLNSCCTSTTGSTIYVDITNSRTWRWADFANRTDPLKVVIDQSRLASNHYVYYDAVGLRVKSDTGADTSSAPVTSSSTFGPTDASRLSNVYNQTVRATDVWSEAPSYLQGQNMTVAVVDSGDYNFKDYNSRIIADANFNASYHTATDKYGHGTFVTGVIAGDGTMSGGAYMGIAPQANVVGVRVSDDQGMAYESDVVNGLQWVNDNRATYNIKVVNMSLNAGVSESYNTSPMDAACEILWFNGTVVVVSAGNNGTANLYAPANDPFVITVGATDDRGTAGLSDDTVAPFSAYGTDETGAAKPDLVAPGTNIIAPLPDTGQLTIPVNHPANVVNSYYFRMSGTSMAAPVVAGAALLLLQSNPNLNPDQVKYRLKATAVSNTTVFPGYSPTTAGAGLLDIYAAVHSTTTATANTGLVASQMLWTGSTPPTWNSVNWGSVNWGSVNWGSVNWGSVNWGSVNWGSDYWAR